MEKGAFISEDGLYRYTLWRDWRKPGETTKTVLFVGLNPSTADADKDDPTIRRCIGFAKAWGYNKLIMVNLFAFRATDPKDMKSTQDPEGPLNREIVGNATDHADLTIAAWGAHGLFKEQNDRYIKYLTNPYHLGLTKNGFPKHPLYLKADVKPEPFFEWRPSC